MTATSKRNKGATALLAMVWIWLAIFAIVLILLWPSAGDFKQKLPQPELGQWSEVSPQAWMAELEDKTPLSGITMAGTHDSGTKYSCLPLITRCQDTDIASQLQMGARALDIRLNSKGRPDGGYDLGISHGFLSCKTGWWIFGRDLSFSDVLNQCYAFLEQNPSETVLMLLKHENGEGTAAEIQAAIDECIGANADKWFIENRDPSLEEVRGKIVLARRYGEGEKGLPGLDFCWKNQDGSTVQPESWEEHAIDKDLSLWVQDRFEYEREDKWNTVKAALANGRTGYSLNYLSTKGSGMVGVPKRYAKSMNARFMELELEGETDYGVLFFDFITPELAEKTYSLNTLG